MAADCAPLRCLGFCGADDSVDPLLLSAISAQHPWVEWGVLFREDKAGQARYASAEWLQLLGRVNTGRSMRLAGHLCAGRADELLRGDTSFIKRMHDEVGFQRFQLNATAANACDVSVFTESADGAQRCVDALRAACAAVPEIELIIQRNTQTRPLWEPLLDNTPPNVSFLFDDSMGLGKASAQWPSPPASLLRFGFAGGLGAANLGEELRRMAIAAPGRCFWVDMESSLRSKLGDGRDVFDCNLAIACVRTVLELGLQPAG